MGQASRRRQTLRAVEPPTQEPEEAQEPSEEQPAPEETPEMVEARSAIAQMQAAIADFGVQLDVKLINQAAQSNAACQALVAAGICTPQQMDTLILRNAQSIVAGVLQQLEERRLAQQKAQQGLSVVERPQLLVAKH